VSNVVQVRESDSLKPGEIWLYYNSNVVKDEIDGKDSYGVTAIGFFFKSKITGNSVYIHPSTLRALVYKPPEKAA